MIEHLVKKTVFSLYILVFFSCVSTGLFARDINLDGIYINPESPYYHTLLEKKLEAYQVAHSQFVDRDVIFACWGDGFTVLYVKEFPRINVVYSYNRTSRRHQELFRTTGTITAFKNSASGTYLFMKRLLAGSSLIPRGETIVLSVTSRSVMTLESTYPFIDFSLAPGGDTLLYETKDGIAEYAPDTGRSELLIRRQAYAGIVRSGEPAIAAVSPNRKKHIIVSGSGGSYRSVISVAGASWELPGLTSASELFWVDNTILVYRVGDAGNYSVNLYNTATRKSSEILKNSLNTNILFSVYPRIISFLKDQVIQVYDVRKQNIIMTGLEGEDVSFSPDGNRFVSIYLKKLFITGISMVKRSNIELMKTANEIAVLYQNLLDSGKNLNNEYSREYIRRKISVYRAMPE
ncbi:MAG: hypothetical protein A2176_14485 [Spirochaetes bacterium RBG_13_51_14]|nr:MAG: hypothetical protein A2176_14485 [Spirochaetes bacterium RBG_13_51_14]